MLLARLSRPRFLRGPAIERPLVAPVISTPRLALRPHRLEDAPDWYAMQTDPDVLRYLDWPERSPEESFEHLAHRTRHTVLAQRDDFLALAVEREGRLVGDIGLHLREVAEPERAVEISWIIDPRQSRRGLATEAATAALDLVFDELAAKRVIAKIDPENKRSIALARRLRFRRTAPDTFETTPALREGTGPLAVAAA
jgi:RimJ/RimL family protein N-acetyltransferase